VKEEGLEKWTALEERIRAVEETICVT